MSGFMTRTPCTFTHDGVIYNAAIQVLMDSRLASIGGGTSYTTVFEENYTGTSMPIIAAFGHILDRLGFNPLSDFTYYTYLDQGNIDSDLASIYNSIRGYMNVESLPSANQTSRYNINGVNWTGQVIPGITTGNAYYANGMTEGLSINMSTTALNFAFVACPEQVYDHGEWINRTTTGRSYICSVLYSKDPITSKYYATQATIKNSNYTIDPRSGIQASIGNLINVLTHTLDFEDPTITSSLGGYSSVTPSGTGGGDGQSHQDIDSSDDMGTPELPTLSAVSSGLMTIYCPTQSQINALGGFLWSSGFEINDFKKLFSNPMDAIIGLGIIPVQPTTAGSKTVMFGDVSTGISMPYASSQFVAHDCGSVTVEKYVGSFLDYNPYTRAQIYLPYCGVREISVDDIMGGSVSVSYNIDILTGGCAIVVNCSKTGVTYQFNGNCIANVPLTANNYSGAIQNAVSAVISGAGVLAGAVTGAAPLTAMGIAGLANSAANTALNAKPSIERSGNMGGSAGLLSLQKPYLIMTRPNLSVPANLNHYTGNTSNITAKLNTLTGFTMIDYIRLDGISATDNEKEELMNILRTGVIF